MGSWIILIKVFTEDEAIQTYVLLDSGSDRIFCETRLISKLNIRKSPANTFIQTMSLIYPRVMDFNLVQLKVSYIRHDFCIKLNEVVEVDSISIASLIAFQSHRKVVAVFTPERHIFAFS